MKSDTFFPIKRDKRLREVRDFKQKKRQSAATKISQSRFQRQHFCVAMARIARRSLRIHGLPLFSLGHPWSSVVKLGETEGLKCKVLDLLD